METHLANLLKLASSPRYNALNSNIQLALDTLATQKVSFAFKAWQIRQKCLAVLKTALESNNQLMTITALEGIEYVVSYPEFEGYTGEESLDKMDAKLLVVQVLDTLNYLPQLRDSEKLHGLKILLNLCCNFTTSFSGDLIIKIVQICSSCCQGGKVNRETQASAEALSTQAVARLANADISNDVTNDVIGLVKFFVQQLELSACNNSRALYLECMLVVLQILDSTFVKDSDLFLSLVHKKLCQMLVSLLNIAIKDTTEVSSPKHDCQEQFNLYKKVFFISTELIRLIGSNEVTGPAMDSLFHALFLWPVEHHKIRIVKFLVKYLSKPNTLLQFLGFRTLKQEDFRYNLLKQLLDDVMNLTNNCVNSNLHLESNFAAVQLVKAIATSLVNFHDSCPIDITKDKEIKSPKQFISSSISDSDLSVYSSPIHSSKSLQSLPDQFKQQFFSMESIQSTSPCYLSAAEGSDGSEVEEFTEDGDLSTPSSELEIKNPDDDVGDDTSICIEDSSTSEEEYSDSDGDISKYLNETNAAYNSSKPSIQHINCQQQTIAHALAQRFIETLTLNLPMLLTHRSIIDIDKELIRMARDFCQETYEHVLSTDSDLRYIVQGESVYLLFLSTLLLNLKLIKAEHYEIRNLMADEAEKRMWVESQQAQGIYLSADFLETVFDHISKLNILKIAGFNATEINFDHFNNISIHADLPVLVQYLVDIDGLGYHSTGSQLRVNFTADFATASSFCNYVSCEDDAVCNEFPKAIMLSLWSRMFEIISQVIRSNKRKVKKQKLIRLPNFKFKSSEKRLSTLETECSEEASKVLIMLLQLGCWHGKYSICRTLLNELTKLSNQHISVGLSLNMKPFFIQCLDAILTYSVEISTHATDCWQYFYQVAEIVSSLHYKFCNFFEDDDELRTTDITSIINETAIKENCLTKGDVKLDYFNANYSRHCINFLYLKLNALFAVIPDCLNCQSLVRFLQGMRKASYLQLFLHQNTSLKIHVKSLIINKGKWDNINTILLFKRIKDCTVECVRNDKQSFLTIFHAWNAVAPHFVEVSCHANIEIATQSVQFLHDILAYFLKFYEEKDFFYICEAFFRPVERAMQLEGCDTIIQNRLINTISDLVAAYPSRIKSGWRCLFNALRYAKVETVSNTYATSPVFDVFKVFTTVCDIPIIATALNDSIKCIFKLLTGYGEMEGLENTKAFDTTKEQFVLYLTKISGLLERVYTSKIPVSFSGSHSIDVTPTANDDGGILDKLVHPQWVDDENTKSLENAMFDKPEMFNRCEVLYIWFSFLDQTAHAALASAIKYQACITSLLTNFIEDLWFKPGPEFAFHTIFYVCLPLLFSWLQRITLSMGRNNTQVKESEIKQQLLTYKHVFGSLLQITSKMLVDFLKEYQEETQSDSSENSINILAKVKLVWRASINLCLLCIKTKHTAIAKLGCSCLNHLFSLTKAYLLPDMIEDVCDVIDHAIGFCLNPLKLLMSCFPITSDKCEKPVTHIDVEIYFAKQNEKHLTANMENFLFAFQDDFTATLTKKTLIKECLLVVDTGKTFDENITLTFSSLGVNMSSLLLLINCVESLLLENICFDEDYIEEENTEIDENSNLKVKLMLQKFQLSQVLKLLNSLSIVSSLVSSFERRLSLKFLLQRLANLQNPANLHRLQVKSFSLYADILFKLCSMHIKESPKSLVLKNVNAVLPFTDIIDLYENSNLQNKDAFLQMPNGDKQDAVQENLDVNYFMSAYHDAVTVLCQEYKYTYSSSFDDEDEKNFEMPSIASPNVEKVIDSMPVESSTLLSPVDNVTLSGSDVFELNWTHDYMAYVRKPNITNKNQHNNPERNRLFSDLTNADIDNYFSHFLVIQKANHLTSYKQKRVPNVSKTNLMMWNKMINFILNLALSLNVKQAKIIYPFLYGPLVQICTDVRDTTTKNLYEEWLRKAGLLFNLIPSRHIY